ncbi:glutamine amidotransferase, partial [Mesorhizobium sp. M2D.F.Ca.ET.145.01.1.1]
MPENKIIGFLFIEGFADWEYGLLAASAVEWFGARAVSLTPGGKPVTGISGFRLTPGRSADADDNIDLDAVAVIGSDQWAGKAPPDASELLTAVAARGGVVGGICAGTLALARAGMFEKARHTSNGRDWINRHEAGYAGDGNYQDVPHAVADGRIVSAPGSAPG